MKQILLAAALMLAASPALAWGTSSENRAGVITASSVFVKMGKCPGWTVDAATHYQAVQATGHAPDEVYSDPIKEHVTYFMGLYRGMNREDACRVIIKWFGPEGQYVTGIVLKDKGR